MNREGRTFWTGCFGQRITGRRSKRQAEPERRDAVVSLSADCPHRPIADGATAHTVNKLAATVPCSCASPTAIAVTFTMSATSLPGMSRYTGFRIPRISGP